MPIPSPSSGTLHRSLGTMAIVGLGLGYMTPTVIFDTFGIVSEETNSLVPLAYLMAMVAMAFTAVSYGRMVRVFPSAGSAYTYASETMHPNVGFLIGWSSLLDYLLLPLVNALILRSYLEAFFPDVPPAVWVVLVVLMITALVLFSMSNTSRLNGILVMFSILLIVVFGWKKLPDAARSLGRSARVFKSEVDEMKTKRGRCRRSAARLDSAASIEPGLAL